MNYTTMKEVTKDEFFGIINEGKLDVLVRPETKEPEIGRASCRERV